jgi:[ribosomal protein S5]-alanine N-acetyltransferase
MEALQMPVLDAPPFRLRQWEPADVPVVQDAARDPLIPLITTVPASGSESEALAFIERQHRRLAEGSGYSFAISDAVSSSAVGQIGLWLKNQQQGRASVGYWIAPAHRRRSAASCALGAVSAWGLRHPGIHRLEL